MLSENHSRAKGSLILVIVFVTAVVCYSRRLTARSDSNLFQRIPGSPIKIAPKDFHEGMSMLLTFRFLDV